MTAGGGNPYKYANGQYAGRAGLALSRNRGEGQQGQECDTCPPRDVLARAEAGAPIAASRGEVVVDSWLPIEIEIAADGAQSIYRRIRKHAAPPFSARL